MESFGLGSALSAIQGGQMVYFHTKNTNLGKFMRVYEDVVLLSGHLVYFIAIWYILWPFGIFHGHLVYFMAIWYISWPFGIFYVWPFGIFYGLWYIFIALYMCVLKTK
jgi:hypothetical protein